MCGKDISFFRVCPRREGSPPRVRERQKEDDKMKFERGITPACAGKTVSWNSWAVYLQDHPRVCGKDMVYS